MFFANDIQGHRIDVNEATTNQEYFCPICQSKLLIKNGSTNAKHFAHMSGECADDWNYDMSDWHKHQQSFFSPEFREKVVSYMGKTHRADILIDNTVIEFQHSPITSDEFMARNRFFRSAGYRIAWVFDVTSQYESQELTFCNRENDNLFVWKHPKRIFSKCPQISDNSKEFALWLTWDSENESDILNKVIWSIKDDCGEYSLKRFAVSPYYIEMNGDIKPDDFFKSQKEYFFDALKELKSKCRYTVKYIGEKGHKREDYCCPRRNEFGVKLGSETGCSYCRYCFMITEKKRKGENKWDVYCCYPNQMREVINNEFEYECERVEFYPL